MEHPLAYYEKRNQQLIHDYVFSRMPIEEICRKYELKEQRVRQILEDYRIQEPKRRYKKGSTDEILQKCGLTKYKVRAELLRNGIEIFEKPRLNNKTRK